jgi:hypothetical protein
MRPVARQASDDTNPVGDAFKIIGQDRPESGVLGLPCGQVGPRGLLPRRIVGFGREKL